MDTSRLKSVLNNAVATEATAAIAGAVTDAKGTVFEHSAGATILGRGVPVTADTIFWIASMTKPLTSLAALQLLEAGKLALDAPVQEFLPELAQPQILENGALHPATQPITLRHLLTHTSGFSYAFTSDKLTAYLAAQGIAAPPGTRASLKLPLLFEPGAAWEYGISTDWLGLLVEAASGETLDAYFNNHITGPLGMTDTVFSLTEEQTARRAVIHQRQPDGSLKANPPNPPRGTEFFSGGGGLFSTLNDYQKFTRLILQGGAPGIASPEIIHAMSVNQIGGLCAGALPSADPALAISAPIFPGMEAKWSFAFVINPKTGPFGRNAGSLSWGGLANTFFLIDPIAGIAAVLLMQVLPSADLAVMKTASQFEKAVYAHTR